MEERDKTGVEGGVKEGEETASRVAFDGSWGTRNAILRRARRH